MDVIIAFMLGVVAGALIGAQVYRDRARKAEAGLRAVTAELRTLKSTKR